MQIFNNSLFYVILYIIFSTLFNEYYKISTITMKDSACLTILIEVIASFFCLLFIPFFKYKLPINPYVYFMLGLAIIFYTIQDRLSTISRSGVESSTYSILKQLSTTFMIIFGIIFFKEKVVFTKLLGAILIILSNILVFYNKKNFKLNKYILSGIVANVCTAIALFIDVNFSKKFNLAIYVLFTLSIPALLVFLFERKKLSSIKYEYNSGNKKSIILTGLFWTVMMISKLRAYQLGQIIVVAPLCSLTVIFNILFSYYHLKEKNNLLKKVIAGVLIIVGIILIKR